MLGYFRYVPAALEYSRNAAMNSSGGGIGEKSSAVSGGAFSFHDMFEHAHNLNQNGGNDNNGGGGGNARHNNH